MEGLLGEDHIRPEEPGWFCPGQDGRGFILSRLRIPTITTFVRQI